MASISSSPRAVEEIFKDYSARRSALIRALTNDVDEFYMLCNPEKENLCLYGHPNELWEVTLPAEEVPPELLEPALGINFARDGMKRTDWLSLLLCIVIVGYSLWLSTLVLGLIAMRVVTGRKPTEDKPSVDSGTKSRNSANRPIDGQMRSNTKLLDESYGEDEDEHYETLCGSCGGNYNADEFWIGCDICERWFYGKCVKITPARAESIKQYQCPSCSTKRSRQ